MLYKSYQDYLSNLQKAGSMPSDDSCVFSSEAVLARHIEKFSEGTSNYIITVDRSRRCLVVCRVEKSEGRARLLHITELEQPFRLYQLFDTDYMQQTEDWLSLVYLYKEVRIYYDPYYDPLPIGDGIEETLADLNRDIASDLELLKLEKGANIVVCDDRSQLLPLRYALERLFEAHVSLVQDEGSDPLQQSQILVRNVPRLFVPVAGGTETVEMVQEQQYRVTVTQEDLTHPLGILGDESLAKVIDTEQLAYDYTIGGMPVKVVQLSFTEDACNNVILALELDGRTLRHAIPGNLSPDGIAGKWSPASTKLETREQQ